MDEKGDNYEVHNLRGNFDISFTYEFTNDPYNESNFIIGDDKYFHDLRCAFRYKYMVETWSLRGFMIEYVISHITDLGNGNTTLICGYKTDTNDDVINSSILTKKDILYIKGGKLLDTDSYIIVKPKYYSRVKVVDYNNKPKQYNGKGTISISSSSDKLYTGYPNKGIQIEMCDDVDILRGCDNIIETHNYKNLNILISHNINLARIVSICEDDMDGDSINVISQYMLNNNRFIKINSSKENDMSYMQYIDNVLYIFLDIDCIDDDIEIIDGFGDKICIEKVIKKFELKVVDRNE